MMPDGTRRPRWDWFQEMFGEPPAPPVADQCTVTFSWLRNTFGVVPDHPTDEMVLMHSSGSCSLASLSAAHRRSRSIQLGFTVLAWLYKSLCRAANTNVVQIAGSLDLLQRWIFWRFPLIRPPTFDDIEWPLASRWYRYLPISDEKEPRLQRLRRQLDLMPFSTFVCLPYRTLESGGKGDGDKFTRLPLTHPSNPGDHDPVDHELPGFEELISDIMREGGSGYRPDTQFNGSPVHLDLNEPMSGLSHLFMALGGTPPSASHVPGASWDVPFMEPARLPTPPVSHALAKQPGEPAAPGRARRAPRHRGCGTGGHM
ncbi:hypothetical protein PIB30_038019 [Stylosanthes scabra]|uniref:Aminotransferase-like plant mobile domain-containing protein n=1 Tax=Stylosanthes scabra TaxID=79078 RepID=A0ABU6SE20_9FABA|nr:hypothetical protein [Stylosanthes scabra]